MKNENDNLPAAAVSRQPCEETVEFQVNRILTDPQYRDRRDVGEDAPSSLVAKEFTRILTGMPNPDVSSFYGELSATWRSGDRIVSVYTDERDGEAVSHMHFGTLSQSGTGSYEYDRVTTPFQIQKKIAWLQEGRLRPAREGESR